MANSIKMERVYSLPERVWMHGEEHCPSINKVDLQDGMLWAAGAGVLLRVIDGKHVHDAAANLRDEGYFYVSAITKGPQGLSAFVRNRCGLKCWRWDCRELKWVTVFDVTSGAPGVLAAWTDRGLVAVSQDAPLAEVIRGTERFDEAPCKDGLLPGVGVHFQMTSSGNGVGVIRHVEVTARSVVSGPSRVLVTSDHGSSWREAVQLQDVLLAGASLRPGSVIVGGVDGAIATVTSDGLEHAWKEDGGDVVAVGASEAFRVAVIESDDEPPVHRLLVLDGLEWIHHEVNFGERVTSIQFISRSEFAVSTRHGIFLGRLN
jgi:hypothetical protein